MQGGENCHKIFHFWVLPSTCSTCTEGRRRDRNIFRNSPHLAWLSQTLVVTWCLWQSRSLTGECKDCARPPAGMLPRQCRLKGSEQHSEGRIGREGERACDELGRVGSEERGYAPRWKQRSSLFSIADLWFSHANLVSNSCSSSRESE